MHHDRMDVRDGHYTHAIDECLTLITEYQKKIAEKEMLLQVLFFQEKCALSPQK